MQLWINLQTPGWADGLFKIKAKGYIAASLFWADENGPLEGWSAFAFVPVSPVGDAEFRFCGHRAIPEGATHVFLRCIAPDFQRVEEIMTEIPRRYVTENPGDCGVIGRFSVMSDLHLTKKTWKIRQALGRAGSPVILLAGDIANDGRAQQYDEFLRCMEAAAPDKILLPVAGNHDWPVISARDSGEAPVSYLDFQDRILRRAEQKGVAIERSGYGHWAADLDAVSVIGLNCVVHPRRLTFSKETEAWLTEYLERTRTAKKRIILCHAPLMSHNPQRNSGESYLGRNRYLQDIVNRHRNLIFISGHTHVSPNYEKACAEYEDGNIYLNSGSVAPAELKGREMYPADWKDGVITELNISERVTEISMRSAASGMRYPRGYYKFGKNDETWKSVGFMI